MILSPLHELAIQLHGSSAGRNGTCTLLRRARQQLFRRTGGSSSHAHGYTGTTDVEDGDIDLQVGSGATVTVASSAHLHPYTGTTDPGSSVPPYTDMVWIIRIK